eukprot:g13963.t1
MKAPVTMLDGGAFDGAKAYKDSKTGIVFTSLYPGCIAETGLFREHYPLFQNLFPAFHKTVTKAYVSQDEAGQRSSADLKRVIDEIGGEAANDQRCSKLWELSEKLEYIEGAPHRIKVGCFAGGAAIVLNGFLSVIDVFDVFDEPIYYVVNAYMVFFGVVTMVTESDPSFIQVHETLTPLQKWMHEWAKGLTMLWGRGLFYAVTTPGVPGAETAPSAAAAVDPLTGRFAAPPPEPTPKKPAMPDPLGGLRKETTRGRSRRANAPAVGEAVRTWITAANERGRFGASGGLPIDCCRALLGAPRRVRGQLAVA